MLILNVLIISAYGPLPFEDAILESPSSPFLLYSPTPNTLSYRSGSSLASLWRSQKVRRALMSAWLSRS